ncbi:uncharacterized protein B0I36DRAFT_110990 [Microdochium trichocladiopsis]|uniref:Uncharacterized protein n=1 Tax=Microdochium trichocladiopsis TaxID=1682393 RepID=A0A9P9BSD6_9PEZI|nr:uncharacterized protein B0I36DRAFT_110990 [Microdochium trichocladiopsis]KAH7033628.1 hypothetical protein B0I36DRAFT_110990 [Microdochium trichocladiopsis]
MSRQPMLTIIPYQNNVTNRQFMLHQVRLRRLLQNLHWGGGYFDSDPLRRLLCRLHAMADVHRAPMPDCDFFFFFFQLHEHDQRVCGLSPDLHGDVRHCHRDSLRGMLSGLQALADVHATAMSHEISKGIVSPLHDFQAFSKRIEKKWVMDSRRKPM